MINKHKRGVALITVIMIMAILAILGSSIMAVSLADTRHAALQERKTQAHYLGRSGILYGLKLLDNKIAAEKIMTVKDTVDSLNSYVIALSPDTSFNVEGVGRFKLKYELFNPNHLKIISEGITSGSSGVSDTVTYIVRVKPAEFISTNPREWLTGINLDKNITESKNLLGKGVEFAKDPLQSPKNPDEQSLFQASVMYFRDYRGTSLRQVTNSIDLTFDAEILYFESGIELEKNDSPIILRISNSVVNYRASHSGVLDSYSHPVGFENYERYKYFIEGCSSDLYSTYTGKFDRSKRYGLVYFGGDVIENKPYRIAIPSGYYFYPDGINLQDINVNSKLIPIPNNDAIIKAIKKFFTSSREGYMWNNK